MACYCSQEAAEKPGTGSKAGDDELSSLDCGFASKKSPPFLRGDFLTISETLSTISEHALIDTNLHSRNNTHITWC